MKKIIIFLFFIVSTLSFVFSSELTLKDGTVIIGNITNETDNDITISVTIPKSKLADNETNKVTFKKPEKKIPAVEGNFEVIQGMAVLSPIDTRRLEFAIKNSLLDYGYRIVSEEPGVITYMMYKNGWDLTMRFCYAPDEYWYEYVSSRNLDANPEENKIHRNYPKWINNLEQGIRRYYNSYK